MAGVAVEDRRRAEAVDRARAAARRDRRRPGGGRRRRPPHRARRAPPRARAPGRWRSPSAGRSTAPRPPRRASRRGRAGRSGPRAWSRVLQRAGAMAGCAPTIRLQMARRPVDPQQSFPELEEQVLARWRERDVFHESVRRREGAEPWVFWEGPPTANGKPGVHHVLARVFKDIYPRYKTMRGYQVERKGGWDTHGLPVEIAVQQQLGIENKQEIEEFGIAEFNQRCREAVFEYLEDWNALTERIGFWIDLDDAYRTLDPTYIESVWWALRQIHDKGLLYEGHKVVPYCPGCGTALSSHEVALGYQDVDRPERLRAPAGGRGRRPAAGRRRAARVDDHAVDPGLQRRGRGRPRARLRARQGRPARRARRRWPRRSSSACSAPKACGSSTASRARRSTACATSRPSRILKSDVYGERGHTVLLGDFVTADDGTGLVHTAIAFGEDDFRLGQQYGLNVVNPVRPDGTYDERIGPYAGRKVKDADPDLIEDLRARGRLLRAETIEHAYPHCWRSGDPLIYYAKRSWYIATSKLRDRLIEANSRGRLAPRAHPRGADGRLAARQRRLGAVARALLGHAAARVALHERLRAHARHRVARRARGALGRAPGGPAPALRRRGRLPVPAVRRAHGARARGHRRLVRLGLDALRAVPRAVREPGALRGAQLRELRVRGARPDARVVLLAAGHQRAALRSLALRDRRLPRAHPRRRGAEDVEVEGQHRRALGRSSTASAPTPCAGTSSPPRTRGTATASTWRRSASRSGSSCASCGTPTPSSRPTSPSARARRPTSTIGSCRA